MKSSKTVLKIPFFRRPSLEEIRSWGESFDKLMRSSGGRKVFGDFLRCEYSEENILFWHAVEELKKEARPEAIEEKARLIYEDYISILSPKEVLKHTFLLFVFHHNRIVYLSVLTIFMCVLPLQVSLDSRVREIVNQNMVDPNPHTFDEAQVQIYTLMHRDSYPRFVNSAMYKKLAQLNSSVINTTTSSGGSTQQSPSVQERASSLSNTASRKQSIAT